jgi:hypothetical protein
VLTNLGGFGLGKWYVEPYDVRIACGSNQDLYASNGFKWAKDFGYTGGSSANLTVKNTLVPMLNTLRYFQISDGPENCYNVSVPVGHYLIRFFIIHFFSSSSSLQEYSSSAHLKNQVEPSSPMMIVGRRSAGCLMGSSSHS